MIWAPCAYRFALKIAKWWFLSNKTFMSVAFAYSRRICAVWARWRIGRDHCDTETERAFAMVMPWLTNIISSICVSLAVALFLSFSFDRTALLLSRVLHLLRPPQPSGAIGWNSIYHDEMLSRRPAYRIHAPPPSAHKHSSASRSFYDYHNLLNLSPPSTCSVPVDELTTMCSRRCVPFPPRCDMHDIGWDLHEPHRKLNFQCNEL